MGNEERKIGEEKLEFPVRDLFQSRKIVFSVFGPNSYIKNIEEMNQTYTHPKTGEKISFRVPTTQESIAIASHDFKNFAKPKIFDRQGLQIGQIMKTTEGIFTNTSETDESKLKALLDNAEKVNGVYLIDNGIAFVPYDAFEYKRFEESGDFARGALARGLEHTTGRIAKNLEKIASYPFYMCGVNIRGSFYPSHKPFRPFKQVIRLASNSPCYEHSLNVVMESDNNTNNYAFGILKTSEDLYSDNLS